MLVTTGEVEKILENNQLLIRMPIYHKLNNTIFATPTDELSVGTIAEVPGLQIKVEVGDKVFVAIENNDLSTLVVLGFLHNKYKSRLTGDFLDLDVNGSAKLPLTTSIGAVSGNQIQYLKNVNQDIQQQLDDINDQQVTMQQSIQNNELLSSYFITIGGAGDPSDENYHAWKLKVDNSDFFYGITGDDLGNVQPFIIQCYDESGNLIYTPSVKIISTTTSINYYTGPSTSEVFTIDNGVLISQNTDTELNVSILCTTNVEEAPVFDVNEPLPIPTPTPEPTTIQAIIDKFIQIAFAEEGYQEKKSNNQLDKKTANPGNNNYNKYAYELKTVATGWGDGYDKPANKNGYAWCSIFTYWCFYILCNRNISKAKEVMCLVNYPTAVHYSAGPTFQKRAYFKNNPDGSNYNDPQRGDIFFSVKKGTKDANKDGWGHTGIVYKVEGNKFYTIEGNIGQKSHGYGGVYLNKRFITGGDYKYAFGRPNWAALLS